MILPFDQHFIWSRITIFEKLYSRWNIVFFLKKLTSRNSFWSDPGLSWVLSIILIATSLPVGTCFANFTLAKFPLPIVFSNLYFPICSSPGLHRSDTPGRYCVFGDPCLRESYWERNIHYNENLVIIVNVAEKFRTPFKYSFDQLPVDFIRKFYTIYEYVRPINRLKVFQSFEIVPVHKGRIQ